jgi:hypothetical protein
MSSEYGDGAVGRLPGDGISSSSHAGHGDAQIPLHGEGEAAEGISILTDATSPPWPGESFVDILQSLGVFVFGDAIVAPGAEGFVEFGDIAAYGDARWAAWVAAGYAASLARIAPLRLSAELAPGARLDGEISDGVAITMKIAPGVRVDIDV